MTDSPAAPEEAGEALDPPAAPEPETFAGVPVSWSRGQRVLHPTREQYLDLLWRLRDDEAFEMCTDLCGADYLTHPGRPLPAGVTAERFEVVLELLSLSKAERIRVRVQVPDTDPTLPSAYEVFPAVDAPEREVWDMFGVAFEGHPDPNRILMPEDWEGHPLRKDFSVGRIPVQFKHPQGRGAPQ